MRDQKLDLEDSKRSVQRDRVLWGEMWSQNTPDGDHQTLRKDSRCRAHITVRGIRPGLCGE